MGRAISAGFACQGADVACLDLTLEAAQLAVDCVTAAGRRALALAYDVSHPDAAEQAVADTLRAFGRLDILVNLAGRGILRPALAYGLEDWTHTIDTYLRSTFLFCQAAGRHMVEHGGGSILNISSIASVAALGRGTGPYAAAKAGVNALTRELAVEWARKGVRVNAIAPCQIDTPQLRQLLADPQFDAKTLMDTWLSAIPMGRLGRPEEMVGPCVFLASDAASLVTGHVLMVDGGFTAR